MVILECFSLQSKLQMHLHCCSKHWHKVDVITGPWVITRSHKSHQWNRDKEIIFGCIAICLYFKSYCWSAFSFSPQGSCSWCAAQCSILRIPMQNPGCHPESMLESKHTEPNKQQSQRLWERPNTQLPRGTLSWNLLKRESSSAWPSNAALSAANPTVTELLTVLLPRLWSQTIDSLSMAVPSDAQESQQHSAGLVMREGGQQKTLVFFHGNALFSAYYKKGQNRCFRIQSKVQV